MSRLFLLVLALSLAPSAPAQRGDAHPLESRIWSSAEGRFVAERELVQALAHSDYRLLGERHDNPEHHALRARLIRELGGASRGAAVVFEQFDAAASEPLARAQAAGANAEALADAGGFDRKDWGWPLHKPLLEAALAAGFQVRGGNLPRADARAIARGAPPADLGSAAWSAAQEAGLRRVIAEGHCSPPAEPLLSGMVRAQRARDAALARSLLAAGRGSILIAGNGHVRRDHGAPIHLGRRALSVGFVEARDGDHEPRAYETGLYDYVWFTSAPAARDNPCGAAR